MSVVFRSRYNPGPAPGAVGNLGPSMTKQSERDSCDINRIVAHFARTGVLLGAKTSPGAYGDFSHISDYRGALETVSQAQATFMSIPARIRARFKNDPSAFVGFCSNPANADALVSMGLATKVAPAASQASTGASAAPVAASTPSVPASGGT